ncbi:hypothetical protein Q7C36_014741 [Tachysurus vachellii]|uniref:Uncharacterized protein n=1 Tax=Tachysurus vachellii TaxID=175792 RepID=A0AA88MDB5_TACVA|nr:hypothetical protein Q7C36_014741 [Tachysurus vachellii]
MFLTLTAFLLYAIHIARSVHSGSTAQIEEGSAEYGIWMTSPDMEEESNGNEVQTSTGEEVYCLDPDHIHTQHLFI